MKYLPYALIILLGFFTFQYQFFFPHLDLDDFYGKRLQKKAYDFHLTSTKGLPVSLSDFAGHYVVLTFGFAKCTDVCPLNLNRMKKMVTLMGSETELSAQFVFVSFDNVRDTKESLKDFLDNFEISKLVGLVSGQDRGQEVASKYFEQVFINHSRALKEDDYQIEHNGFIYIINPQGELILLYSQKNIDEVKVVKDLIKISKKEKKA